MNIPLGTTVVPPSRVTPPPLTTAAQGVVPTTSVLPTGSTPLVIYDLTMEPFAKVSFGAPNPFKARFLSTEGVQIMETDSGIHNPSIAGDMFVNCHLSADITMVSA